MKARILPILACTSLTVGAQNVSFFGSIGAEPSMSAQIVVVRSGDLNSPLSVRYATRDGSAEAGGDFLPQSGVLTFAAGETEKLLTVPVVDDRLVEPEWETFELVLRDAASDALLFEASLAIQDDDFTDHLDETFQPQIEPCWPCALALQADGRVLAATPSGIVRLLPDGSRDTSFKTAVTGSHFCVQPDGRILVRANAPVGLGANSRRGIVRLNPDGSLDLSFNANEVTEGGESVRLLALETSGSVIVSIHDPAQTFAPRLVRLTSTGASDPGFTVEAAPGFERARSEIMDLLVQPDGAIVMTGYFDLVNNVERHGIARLLPDGTVDAAFDAGSLMSYPTERLAWRPVGGLLVGSHLRLQGDGSLDPAYTAPQLPGSFARRDRPEALIVQPDDRLLVGTLFGVARVNADGSRDWGFRVLTTTTVDDAHVQGRVEDMVLASGTQLLIAGSFDRVNGVPRPGLARLNLSARPAAPRFASIHRTDAGVVHLVLSGQIGAAYALDHSPDLKTWWPISTNTATGLTLEFEDADAAKHPRRFYRARMLTQR